VRFGSGISRFNVADLEAGIVRVDVMEFDRRRGLTFIRRKIVTDEGQPRTLEGRSDVCAHSDGVAGARTPAKIRTPSPVNAIENDAFVCSMMSPEVPQL
jgi:hypothetical protein